MIFPTCLRHVFPKKLENDDFSAKMMTFVTLMKNGKFWSFLVKNHKHVSHSPMGHTPKSYDMVLVLKRSAS
jgi:hypothetical protein